MTSPPDNTPPTKGGHPDAQVRAVLRNLVAKTLTYFGRNEVAHLRLMSEHLLDMAQQAGSSRAADSYRWRSVSFLLDKQTAVPGPIYQDALKEQLQQEVQGSLEAGKPRAGARTSTPDALDGMTLSLIDVTEMDRLLSIDQISQRFNSHYETELALLNQRLGTLITGDTMVLAANPFRPEVLVRSLMQGWKNSGFDEQVCNDLLGSLTPKHSLDLNPLYEDMNATLLKAGVSFKATHRIRKSSGGDAGSGGATGSAASAPGQPTSGYGSFSSSQQGSGYDGSSQGAESYEPAGATQGYGPESYGHAGQAPAGEAFGPGSFNPETGELVAPQAPAGAAAAGATGRGGFGQTIAAHARQFLQMLGFGSGGARTGAAGPAMQAPADPSLMGYLGGLQADGGAAFMPVTPDPEQDPAAQNVLRAMREQEQIKQAAEIDRGTVDALAEVFDYVFADPAIPAPLKVIIGRLQIPVLKAAMIDREFFHSAEHPARKLIDALAKAAVTWNEDKGKQDPLFRRIDDTVQRALREFDNELSLFSDLLLEFEEFQEQAEQEVQRQIEPVAQVEQSDEALRLARAHADEVIHGRINALPPEIPLAPLLMPFLTTQWREVMAQAWLKVQQQPELWNNALTTVGRLIWSTQPQSVPVERRQRDLNPPTPDGERRELMKVLPELVRSLEAGLNSIGWSGAPREAFMRGLMELHMHAVRLAPATPEELQRRASESQAGQEAMRVLEERRAQASIEAKVDTQSQARALTRGMWFDFLNDQGQVQRCRLSWISPKRTRLLFTSREGFDAFVRTEHEVAELLRYGRLSEINQAPIVGRALDQIMAAA